MRNGYVPGSGQRISPPGLLSQWKKHDSAAALWCGSGAPYFKWQRLSKVTNFLGLIEHAICLLVKPVFGQEDLLLLAMMNAQEK